MAFECVVPGPPVSAQTRRQDRRRAWQARVISAASRYWAPGRPPLTGALTITLVYYCEGTHPDIDNLPKPVLDALEGLIFIDDNQFTDAVCRIRPLEAELGEQVLTPVLAEGFELGQEFVYVRIEDAPQQ